MKLEAQISVKSLLIFVIFEKLYLVKIGPIYDGLLPSCLTRYQQNLLVCSFGAKNLLDFTCNPMIFHNRHHPSVYLYLLHMLTIFDMR